MRYIWILATFGLALAGCVTEEETPAQERDPGRQDGMVAGGGGDGSVTPDPDDGVPRDASVGPADAFFEDAFWPEDAQAPIDGGNPPPVDAGGPADPCELCAPIEACGYPLSRGECRDLCGQAPPALARCILQAPDCEALEACFEGPDEPGPPPAEELCRAFCQRQAQCINRECAPGALVDGFQGLCFDTCLDDPPEPGELAPYFEALCPDIIDEIRGWYPEVSARCDNDEQAVCELLCSDRVANCDPQADVAECTADCEANWTPANITCVQFTPQCRGLLGCFGDPEGQARCEAACAYQQECLAQACPPRIIPPELSTNCTAGCLPDPPSPEETEQWLAAECRAIREFTYQGNQQLRPICEGGREFRPSPDECADFCDNVLLECLGVGNRAFCLAGCAAFTRDEYVCMLEGQGQCDAVNACLGQ